AGAPVHRAHRGARRARARRAAGPRPAAGGLARARHRHRRSGRARRALAVLVVRRAATRERRPRRDPPLAVRPAVALLRASRRGTAGAEAALMPAPDTPDG